MPAPGDRLAGRYELVEPIGSGGMAVVWRARDLQLRRTVAVKVLRPQFAEEPEFVQRFTTEARHAASLAHENVAAVYDSGVEGDTRYIVMELVDGPSVAELIQGGGRLPVPLAVKIAASAARALAAAHRRGLVHRDVKPANLLIGRDGRVRLADFGIARALSTTRVTTAGVFLGSGPYMSPEQRRGEEVMAASDLYSLGVVLFEMLHGRLPAVANAARPETSRGETVEGLPAGINGLVERAIQPDPARRFPSARAFADALDAAARRLEKVDRHDVQQATVPVALVSSGLGGADSRSWATTQVHVASPTPEMAAGAGSGARVSAQIALAKRPSLDPGRRSPRDGRRRRGAPLPVWFGMGVVVASAVVALGLLTAGARLASGVLEATGSPAIARASAVPAAPSASRPAGSDPSLAPGPSASPAVKPTSTPLPTERPVPTPRPTPVLTAPPRITPAGAVEAFYGAVEAHAWDTATDLWSTRMQRRYPPDEWLVGRFSKTTRIDLVELRQTALDTARGTAVVAVTIVEYRTVEPSPRRFAGSWELVRAAGRWLLDEPHF